MVPVIGDKRSEEGNALRCFVRGRFCVAPSKALSGP